MWQNADVKSDRNKDRGRVISRRTKEGKAIAGDFQVYVLFIWAKDRINTLSFIKNHLLLHFQLPQWR